MQLKKLGLFLFVVLLAGILLTACAPAAPADTGGEEAGGEEAGGEEAGAGGAEEKVFTVGILGPFTGPSARTGDEFRTATEMRFEDIDYTIGDYTINVVWIDSQSDPEKATRAYEEAIVQDGVQVGALNWHSSVAVAVMEVTAKHQIPHLFGFGATEVVNEKFQSDQATYGYWTTKGWPRPDLLSQNYVTAVSDAIDAGLWEPNMRAAIYGEDTDWGRSFGDGIASQLEDAGWEIVDTQYFPLEQTEFGPVIQRFQDDDVDLIAGTSTAPPSISAFIKQADEQGLESLIIADGLGWYDEWYDLTGDASNYVVDQIPGWTTDAGLDFAKAFTDRHGQEPSPSSGGMAYDGVGFLIEVLKATYDAYGELSSENVMNVVRDQVWTGDLTYTTDDGAIMMSEYNFSDPLDPIVGKGYYAFPVLQYMDGEGVAIWPPEFEQGQLQPPE
jgi:branched-chain amino acid transport system substrate-binding protein